MKVKDILKGKRRRGEVLRVSHDGRLTTAVDMMVANDTGSVAIFEGDTFLGMLTFREVFATIRNKGFAAAAEVACDEVVEKDGHCATPDDSVDQVRNIMTKFHIRYLPVIQDGHLSDIISFYDVARSVAKAADFENRMLKEYIGDWPAGEGD